MMETSLRRMTLYKPASRYQSGQLPQRAFPVARHTVRHLGRLDILVNNAGLAPDNLAENVRERDFDLTLAVNLKGTFFASQAAGRVMIEQKSGRIINMSSQA